MVEAKYDPAIYPRSAIDEKHVKELIDALNAGASFPPLKVLPDGRIVDGVHRFHAHQQVGTEAAVEVVDVDDGEELFEAAVFNVGHGKRMDPKDLQEVVKWYWRPEWKGEYEERGKRIGKTGKTLENWTRELRDDHKEQQRMDAMRRLEAGETQEQIAKALGVTQKTVSVWASQWELYISEKLRKCITDALRPYTTWTFSSCSPLFGIKYPGRLPGELIGNVVHWFTEEGDLVVDPMAGGGTTHDVCEALDRRCVCYDLVPARPFIVQNDFTAAMPEAVKEADLVFLDPPYTTMKKGAYSDHEENVANWTPTEFFEWVGKVAGNLHAEMKDGAKVAFIIADQTGKDLDGGRPLWSGLRCANAFLGAGFQPVAFIDAPLSQDSLQPQQITKAHETKQLLGLVRILFVMEKVE